MKIGSLVKHIEFEYIGVIFMKEEWRLWVHWGHSSGKQWYGECELEEL